MVFIGCFLSFVSLNLQQVTASPVSTIESWALSIAVHAWDLSKEVTIIFIASTIIWPQVKQQGGNTVQPISSKLKIY